MKNFVNILFVLLCSANLYAQNSPIYEGNEHYQKGEYEEAIKAYEAVLQTNVEAAEIYFNLANAYYKIGQIAPAILNYERAKLLAPGDKDIQYNLKMAKAHVLDKLEEVPELFIGRWILGIRNAFSANLWAYISMALFVLCLLFFCFYLYGGNKIGLKKMGFFFSCLTLIFSLVAYSFAATKAEEIKNRNFAIIFSPSVTIKGSPAESGTDLFLLHEGTKVKLIDELGDWRNIKLSDGNEGWLKSEDIEEI